MMTDKAVPCGKIVLAHSRFGALFLLPKWLWLVGVSFTLGGFGEVCTWTGAGVTDGVGAWSNTANWQEGKVPGTGDTAVFGALTAGAASTVMVDGDTVLNIRFVGVGTPAYSFVGAGTASVLNLENHGFIEVADTVTNDQTFSCVLTTTFSKQSSDSLSFTNFSATARLKLGDAKWSNEGGNVLVTFSGGCIELMGKTTEYVARSFNVANGCKLYFTGRSAYGSWRPKIWDFQTLSQGSHYIYIADGAEGLRATDGGYYLKAQAIWRQNACVDGPGVVPARLDTMGYPYAHQINGNVTVTFNAVLTSPDEMSTTLDKRLNHSVFITRYPDGSPWNGARIAILNATNTFTGPLMIGGDATVKAAKFGSKGCSPLESNIGCGNEVIFVGSNGNLDYTGVGETCNRDFHYHQSNGERWTWSASFWDKGYAGGCVRNSGTGALTLTGEVTAQEAPDAGVPAKFHGYPTNCLFKLDGAKAPIIFAGTTGGNHKFAFETAGTVTLKTFPANFTNLILNAATVTIDPELGNGTNTILAVQVAANSSMKLAAGYVLKLGALNLDAGKTLDFLMDDSVEVTLADATEGTLANVTINGAPVYCTAAGRLVGEGTAWRAAVDGRWADESKWNDGLPSTTKPGRVNLMGDLTIALDSSETIGEFSVVENSGKATVAVSGTLTAVAGSKLTIGRGGEIKVLEGGAVTLNAPANFAVRDGGKITVTGGELNVVSPTAYDCASTESGAQSAIETQGGNFTLKVPDSAHRFTTGSGFALGGTAGKILIHGVGNWYQSIFSGRGTDTNYFSGTAEFVISNSSSQAFAANGRYAFTDSARLLPRSLNSAPSCFMPESDGHTLEFVFKDHAGIGRYDVRKHGILALGCPANAMPNGVTRFILDSATEHYARGIAVGMERTSQAEFIQKQGTLHVADEGISIGTFWEAYWINGAANCGIYRMQGGVLDIAGGGYVDNKHNWFGLLVGWGMLDGYREGNHTLYSNYRFNGRFELDDGVVTNSVGIVAVGAGRADGEFVQRGGTFVSGTYWAAQGEATPKNPKYYPGLHLVGGFTGTGLWAISNGVVKGESAYEHTYVGGVDLATLRAHTRRVAQGSSDDGADVLNSVAADEAKSATGRLEVVDGMVNSKGDLIVGARGHGEVALIGSKGGVRYRNVVMSNNVESVARFVLDATGVKPIVCTGTATIVSGAKLVVDVTGFTGRGNRHALITAAGGVTGRFADADVTIVGGAQVARLAVIEQDAAGVRLVIPRGMRIIFR